VGAFMEKGRDKGMKKGIKEGMKKGVVFLDRNSYNGTGITNNQW
jgi:hypothetical protein